MISNGYNNCCAMGQYSGATGSNPQEYVEAGGGSCEGTVRKSSMEEVTLGPGSKNE